MKTQHHDRMLVIYFSGGSHMAIAPREDCESEWNDVLADSIRGMRPNEGLLIRLGDSHFIRMERVAGWGWTRYDPKTPAERLADAQEKIVGAVTRRDGDEWKATD